MDEQYIDQLEGMTQDPAGQLTNQAFGNINSPQNDNLVVFQLELDNIIEKIEHLLRGDVLTEDSEGNVIYTAPKDTDLIVMNEYGVQLVLNLLSMYLNRNTILSNYKEDRIYEIMYDLGNELSDLIYINYEKMGMDTPEKKSRYPFIVMNILHMVESAYNRSLQGNELESLRSARVVTQSQPLQTTHQQMIPQQPQRNSWNPFKRWM